MCQSRKSFKEEAYDLVADAALNGCIRKLCNGEYDTPDMIGKCVDEYTQILELLMMWVLGGKGDE